MNAFRVTLSLILVTLTARPGAAQSVQLPTLSSFRAGTAVSVPDRGSVYIGGINRAADGRNEFGTPLLPLRNRSIGSERSASSMWTSVYIHDFEAMDEALLSQARASGYGVSQDRSPGPATRTVVGVREVPGPSRTAGTTWQARSTVPTSGPMSKSVAELRAERAGELQARTDEAERLFERGKTAEAAGKLTVARIYYQQASRRASGPLQEEILAQLRLIAAPTLAQR